MATTLEITVTKTRSTTIKSLSTTWIINRARCELEVNLVHLNHVREVYEKFEFVDHGLLSTDINRDDKQNWRSAQRLSFSTVRDLLNQTGNHVKALE